MHVAPGFRSEHPDGVLSLPGLAIPTIGGSRHWNKYGELALETGRSVCRVRDVPAAKGLTMGGGFIEGHHRCRWGQDGEVPTCECGYFETIGFRCCAVVVHVADTAGSPWVG